METGISDNITNALKKELEPFGESMEDILKDFQKEKLDISALSSFGFKHEETTKGTVFVDELRTFFHKKDIDDLPSLWIINTWGRIGTFKDNDRNREKIKKFQSALGKKELTKELFDVISSLSKIASFVDYEKYFVYDSRVVYTLNWLILKNNIPDPKFFPMPASRTKNLTIFDLDTIINLFYKDKMEGDTWEKDLRFDHKHAYFIYCELIKRLNTTLFPPKKPYYLEMLLYTIADKIFNDLKASVQIKII